MGGWKIESFKMVVYMAFPVVTFYIFHQPAYFEEWVIKKKLEMFPPEDYSFKEKLVALAKEKRTVRDAKLLESLENSR